MEITTIRVRRLLNTGNYENWTLELEALVSPTETPLKCIADLTALVDEQVNVRARAVGLPWAQFPKPGGDPADDSGF